MSAGPGPTRRRFLLQLGLSTLAPSIIAATRSNGAHTYMSPSTSNCQPGGEAQKVSLFLCGDVMTGRGIDQILPHPSAPSLREPYVRDARDYVELAEQANGEIPLPVEPSYPWGEALQALDQASPEVRIINLETSITTSEDYWPNKGIHYRMHPRNIGVLTVARPAVVVLANNHVLDFGYRGLIETLAVLEKEGTTTAGAGRNLEEAQQPARVEVFSGNAILVFGFGMDSSGVPPAWAALKNRAGVDILRDLSDRTAAAVAECLRLAKRPGDLVVASIHWGSNWGYGIPSAHVRFAHQLIDLGVDLVHGHSSHHPRPIEVYKGKLILYGCGDFINDYEGISGYEEFRDDLRLMYFAQLDGCNGELLELRMVPMKAERLRLIQASRRDAQWLRRTLTQASLDFGTHVKLLEDQNLLLEWE
jgi:poly-gamma-glutamate capsule biosynthesis protein CapA/YwtB (metallophosphatase superfamily)